MGDELCVEVSGDLAEILTGAGFDEVVSFRGFETDSYTVLTVVPATIAVAANLATILVSREAVGDLIDGIRSWMGRHAKLGVGSEFVVEVSARRGSTRTRLRITSRYDTREGAPKMDTAALTSLAESIFTDAQEDHDAVLPPRA